MRLQSIQTIEVAQLPDRTYDLRGRGGSAASLVFVTGPTGSGKTLLLDVIAAAKETVAPAGSHIAQSWHVASASAGIGPSNTSATQRS